jgi:hypothetical protein
MIRYLQAICIWLFSIPTSPDLAILFIRGSMNRLPIITCLGLLVLARAIAHAAPPTTRPALPPGPLAKPAPPAPPATSTAPARRTLVMPPGFHRVAVGSRIALCQDADHTWVQHVLADTKPTTMPTTMPTDLVRLLTERRQLLKGRIAADLTLTDTTAVDKLIDQTLLPKAQKLQQLQVPVFYLVCSRSRLRELVRGGWEDPRFHYNRAANEVYHDPRPVLYDDRPMDDTLLSAVYNDDMPQDARERGLSNVVRNYESAIASAIASHAQAVTQVALVEFIQKQATEPMKLKPDQAWFGQGLETVLSSRYMADLTGADYEQVVGRLLRDRPGNPVRAATVDLLHPPDPATMRPEWVPAQEEAMRIRSSRVVHDLIAKGGQSAVPMCLSAIRVSPPADGPALVRLIAAATGVDLSSAVKPQ